LSHSRKSEVADLRKDEIRALREIVRQIERQL
jgi:hypothetical protein